jgi:hypothetical protein
MLPVPDRIWIVRKEFSRFGGTELVEHIIYHESMVTDFLRDGYEVTPFIAATAVRGIVHAASTRGKLPNK